MSKIKLIVTGIVLFVVSIVVLLLFEITTVEGNQLGVKETWAKGVEDVVLQPKTYFLFPGYSQKIYAYDAASQVYTLENYKVQSQEGQDLIIDIVLQWRRDPAKLVFQHKTIRNNIEQKIINPVMLRIVKDKATAKKAIEAYSGAGLVALQTEIQQTLADKDGELVERGVIVEQLAIRHIDLDPKYIEEIKGRQIATQRQLRAVEEQKAAEAEALVAKSKAQADLNKVVVEAERDKQVQVLAAEAANEKAILAAQAEKQKMVLEGEGSKLSQIAKAEGILAMGKAEAEAQKLKLQTYAVDGADGYVKVEVAKSVSEAFKGISGYLPSNMSVNLLTENFGKAVDVLTGKPVLVKP